MIRMIYCVFPIIILLAGCATASLPKNYDFNELSKKGILIGSMTFDGPDAWYNIFARRTDIKTENDTRIAIGSVPLLPFGLSSPSGKLDSSNVKGDLFTIELDPGEYEVYRWFVKETERIQFGKKLPKSIKFKIEPGKAYYFGSLHFRASSQEWFVTTGIDVSFLNHYERDIKISRNHYKNLTIAIQNHTIKTHIPTVIDKDMDTGPVDEMKYFVELLFNQVIK